MGAGSPCTEERPKLRDPILYVFGDSAHQWGSNGVPRSILLPKPFARAVEALSTLLIQMP